MDLELQNQSKVNLLKTDSYFLSADANATISSSVQKSIEIAISIIKKGESEKPKPEEKDIDFTNQHLSLLEKVIIKLVLFYQKIAPASLRKSCRFEPSCSNYMILAVEKYGALKGFGKGITRICRCHYPNGGIDFP